MCNKLKAKCDRRFFFKFAIIGSAVLTFENSTLAISLRRSKKKKGKKTDIQIHKKERCPVCGMFVTPFPKWLTQIQFKDGTHHTFDGMKCLFRYYFTPEKFNPDGLKKTINRILVRDYYNLEFIDHDKAIYVVGSNVYGPMGHEVIPFGDKKAAETFLSEHVGLRLYRFDQVTIQLLDRLDASKKKVSLEGIP